MALAGRPAMNVAVLNAGSGSFRSALHVLPAAGASPGDDPRDPVWELSVDSTAPGQPTDRLLVRVRTPRGESTAGTIARDLPPAERARELLPHLWSGPHAPLGAPQELAAIGHRIVHGGDSFDRAVAVDAGVEAAIERWAPFAPLHNPVGLAGIRAARDLVGPATTQIAVFDTAFHRTLPEAAATYPGPIAWRAQGIRRYGFHGISYRWASERAASLLGRAGDPGLRLVLCHLGGGCSLCATRGGRSLDTTMGLTPLDGIAMSTRPGALDPGILLHLVRGGMTADELDHLLNRECGLKGLSGISGDTRELTPRAARGDGAARLALDVFVHRLRAGIGQMLAALDGPADAIVFTDVMAESEPDLRAAACAPFDHLGLRLDPERNRHAQADADLSAQDASVRVLLVRSRESWQIARECHALVAARELSS